MALPNGELEPLSEPWPAHGYSLLPRPLREAWQSERPPSKVLERVGLPKGWTYLDADESVWDKAAHPEAMHVLVADVVARVTAHLYYRRHAQIAQVPLLARPVMSIADLDRLPLSMRTKNSLRRSGKVGDVAWFASATARDVFEMRGLGARSVLELSCVLERWRDLPPIAEPAEAPSGVPKAIKALARWIQPAIGRPVAGPSLR